MKINNFYFLVYLAAMFIPFAVCSCSSDDDKTNSSTSLTLTNDGYFDGLLYYKITSNSPQEVEISKADKEVKTVIIPSNVKIDGKTYTCTTIGKNAFNGCSQLTSVTISPSIICIGNYAFSGCKGLTSIIIPDNVISIDEGAFQYCTNLTSATISDNIICIGIAAFYECRKLETITLNARLIGELAFYGCNSLGSIHLKAKSTNGFNYIVYDIDEKYHYATSENYSGAPGQGGGMFGKGGHEFKFNYFSDNFHGVADNNVYSNATLYIPKNQSSYYYTKAWTVFENIIEE